MGGQERDRNHETSEPDGRSRLRRWMVPGLALIPVGVVLVSLVGGLYRESARPDIDEAMADVRAEYEERINSGDIDVADLTLQAQLNLIRAWEGEPSGTHGGLVDSLPVPDGFRLFMSGPDGHGFVVHYTEARAGHGRRCFRVALHPDAAPDVDRSSCTVTWE